MHWRYGLGTPGLQRLSGLRPDFTQRAGRQQPAVANAAVIKDCNVQIASQGVMLQTVVANDQVGVRIGPQQGLQRIAAAAGHKHRRAGTLLDQQRLIATQFCRKLRQHFQASLDKPSITARDHAGASACGLQVLHHGHDQRCFASATGHQIAHHHHRNVRSVASQPMVFKQPSPDAKQRPVKPGQRPQQACQPAALHPGALQGLGLG